MFLDEKEQNLIAFQYNGQIYYRVFQPIDEGQELMGMNLVFGYLGLEKG